MILLLLLLILLLLLLLLLLLNLFKLYIYPNSTFNYLQLDAVLQIITFIPTKVRLYILVFGGNALTPCLSRRSKNN